MTSNCSIQVSSPVFDSTWMSIVDLVGLSRVFATHRLNLVHHTLVGMVMRIKYVMKFFLFHSMLRGSALMLNGLQDLVRGSSQVVERTQRSTWVTIRWIIILTPIFLTVVLFVRAAWYNQIHAQIIRLHEFRVVACQHQCIGLHVILSFDRGQSLIRGIVWLSQFGISSIDLRHSNGRSPGAVTALMTGLSTTFFNG